MYLPKRMISLFVAVHGGNEALVRYVAECVRAIQRSADANCEIVWQIWAPDSQVVDSGVSDFTNCCFLLSVPPPRHPYGTGGPRFDESPGPRRLRLQTSNILGKRCEREEVARNMRLCRTKVGLGLLVLWRRTGHWRRRPGLCRRLWNLGRGPRRGHFRGDRATHLGPGKTSAMPTVKSTRIKRTKLRIGSCKLPL